MMKYRQFLDLLLALTGGAMVMTGLGLSAFWQRLSALLPGAALLAAAVWLLYRDCAAQRGEQAVCVQTQQDTGTPAPTEIVLLNEQEQAIASWTLYGRTGLVIGRERTDNEVQINLAQSVYAGTVEDEHAVLNYAAGCWYVEDLHSQNGVRVQKEDRRQYRLAAGQPCRLSIGDILYIGLVRLQLR